MRQVLFTVILFITSCGVENSKIEQIDIEKINGYWEIVQAQNPHGKNVIYNINSTVDYIELKDSLGFRKKLKQNVGGRLKTSQNLDKFEVVLENDTVKLAYRTLYSTWKESVLRLNDSLMLIKNENDFLYTYKRYNPLEN